jgi:hypothetical protein
MAKLKASLDARDLEEASKVQLWRLLILPDWTTYRQDRRTRELWWRGIPPSCRGKVWLAGIGNELELSESSYRSALIKAQERLRAEQASNMEEDEGLEATVRHLIAQTWPEERLFCEQGLCSEAIRDLLFAYSAYRPDVPMRSIPGISRLAALLVLNMNATDSFIALANLLNRPIALALLANDALRLHTAYANTIKLIHIQMPDLHSHFLEKLAMPPSTFLQMWFESLGTQGLSIDAASRLWDVIVMEGDRALVRAAVAWLKCLEPELYIDAPEEVSKTLRTVSVGKSAEEWVTIIRDVGKVGSPVADRKVVDIGA